MTTLTLLPGVSALLPGIAADAASTQDHPAHDHSTGTVSGYVVRRLIRDGEIVAGEAPNRLGEDVAFASSEDFAHSIAAAMCTSTKHAVVDVLYACGCRT